MVQENTRKNSNAERLTSRLTSRDVLAIRKRYKRTSINSSNSRQLAKEFGVCKRTILNIAQGKFWKHVPTKQLA